MKKIVAVIAIFMLCCNKLMVLAEEDFDPVFYANTYPDLKAAYGDDPEALYNHYVNFGKAEGRMGKAPDTITPVNEDSFVETFETVVEDNSAYEYIAAEGYRYLLQRDAAALNPGTLKVVRFAKVEFNENNFFIFAKMANSGVIIEYSRINDYGFEQSHSLVLMKSSVRTSAWNQIISADGTYTTVIGMSGLQLEGNEFEVLDVENILNCASGVGDVKWYIGKNNHRV